MARRLVCSFCHRGEAEVEKLVAGPRVLLLGPRVHICDVCVGIALRMMGAPAGERPPRTEGPTAGPHG